MVRSEQHNCSVNGLIASQVSVVVSTFLLGWCWRRRGPMLSRLSGNHPKGSVMPCVPLQASAGRGFAWIRGFCAVLLRPVAARLFKWATVISAVSCCFPPSGVAAHQAPPHWGRSDQRGTEAPWRPISQRGLYPKFYPGLRSGIPEKSIGATGFEPAT
jgi:hypothetical protein